MKYGNEARGLEHGRAVVLGREGGRALKAAGRRGGCRGLGRGLGALGVAWGDATLL